MHRETTKIITLIAGLAIASLIGASSPSIDARADGELEGFEWRSVSGTGVHHFDSAIIHSSEQTARGKIERRTETVELSGDLVGRVLYHPTSVFDFEAGTLVNSGHQVFSGTVLGSDPVLLHDDEFRFEIDLESGATSGEVHFVDTVAGPLVHCHLQVMGTGRMSSGAATVDYSGRCRLGRDGFESSETAVQK